MRSISISLCAMLLVMTIPAGVTAGPVDLTTWTAVTLDMPGGQSAGNWVLSGGNTVATQTLNADPSFFLNGINQTNYVIEGSWRVITSGDDDFMGFVFGYQSPADMYVFDWKQGNQNEGGVYGGLALEGFSIKKISAAAVGDLTHHDFWVSQNTAHSTLIHSSYSTTKGWADFVTYDFRLVVTPANFHVTVKQGATVLYDVTLPGNATGQFGFYNYSQAQVQYAGFEQSPIFSLDMHPTSCPNPINYKSRGVMPAAILGSEEGDVLDIDVSTILLEGVAPIRTGYEDVATLFDGDLCGCSSEGGDGFYDLTLKFKNQELLAALGGANVGDEFTVTLTGQLLDGTPFELSDCVIVRGWGIDGPGNRQIGNIVTFETGGSSQGVQEVRYSLRGTSQVQLSLYSVTGRLVRDIVQEAQGAGDHTLTWDAAGLPSGVYFYRLEANGFQETKRITLIR